MSQSIFHLVQTQRKGLSALFPLPGFLSFSTIPTPSPSTRVLWSHHLRGFSPLPISPVPTAQGHPGETGKELRERSLAVVPFQRMSQTLPDPRGIFEPLKRGIWGTSLKVQWLRFCPSKAGGMILILDWGTKIPHAAQHSKKKNYFFN